MLGGIMIGLLTILGDMVNAIGSSTGILLSTSIIYRYCEKIGKNWWFQLKKFKEKKRLNFEK